MLKKKLLLGFVAMAVLTLLISPPIIADSPRYGGEFIGFSFSDPQTLDPASLDAWDQDVMAANVLEGLVRLSPCGMEIEEGVAESWEVSEDGLQWTFYIRDNAKFHNDEAVTASDVKYSFERVVDPETRSPQAWLFSTVEGYREVRDGQAEEVEGIEVLDDYTLVIRLTEPLTPFLSMLAAPGAAIIPENADKEIDNFGMNVVSAGPFKLSEWQENVSIMMAAFEDYWDGRPYLDNLGFRFIHDENTRVVELMAGSTDWAWVTPAYHEALTTTPEYQDSVRQADTLHVSYFIVNKDREPFGDSNLMRQAFRYALDVETLVESLLQGRAHVAKGLYPPGFMGYDPEAEAYPYDIDKARRLLEFRVDFPIQSPSIFLNQRIN